MDATEKTDHKIVSNYFLITHFKLFYMGDAHDAHDDETPVTL